MSQRTAAITARCLSKQFDHHKILRKLNLEVEDGESVSIMGANGAGKTTLLRCLACTMRPSSGQVWWFGRLAGKNLAMRRQVGMVLHESQLYAHLSLRENLVFAARMCAVSEPVKWADQWLDDVAMRAHANSLPRQISQGMRKRVSIARAFVHDPRILLLDEPFCGLDNEGAECIEELLGALRKRGRTVCFITHDRQRAIRLADRALVLRSGQLEDVSRAGTLSLKADASHRRVA